MVTPAASPWSSLGWRARRPLVRRRLHAALIGQPDRRWLSVWDLAHAAGLDDMPSGEVHAIVTELVNAGQAEGLRGPRGWARVRASANAAAQRRLIEDAVTERRPRADGWLRSRAEAAVQLTDAASFAPSMRAFSVASRLPARRSNRFVSGLAMFCVAIVAGVIATLAVRAWSDRGAGTLTRSDWYAATAHDYAAGYLAHRKGFELPYRFTEVTGVQPGANVSALEGGLVKYVQATLYTGLPSEGGILAWARSQFGELPALSGPAADAWLHSVAQTYAIRMLNGTSGYELTPALATAGGLTADQRDPAAVTAGLQQAVRAALYLGTPQPGGVLDWARRTHGDLPAR